MICPATLQECCDDLCVISCLKLPGVEPLTRCSTCGHIVGEDIECDCKPEIIDWDDDE